jgi:osmotically inducible protein OsmC
VAKKENIDIGKATVQADIDLNQDAHGFSLGATLNITIPGVDNATAEKLVQAAHQLCPYSKATRGNIDVQLKVNDQPLAKAA